MPRSKRPAKLPPVPSNTPAIPPATEPPRGPDGEKERTGQTADQVDPTIQQAYEDLRQGQVDTDMRSTPGLDAPRRRRLVPVPPRGA